MKLRKDIPTPRENSLDRYLNDIEKIPRITAEEEVELAKKIKAGDQQALEKLVKANLRFVVSVAKQHQHKWNSLPDLINEGNRGLIEAAKKFDETRGFKFITHANSSIHGYILKFIADDSNIVRRPTNKTSTIKKLGREYSLVEQIYYLDPSPENLQNLLLAQNTIQEKSNGLRHSISFDTPLGDEKNSTFSENFAGDLVPADLQIHTKYIKKSIHELLDDITGSEETKQLKREIIMHIFEIDREKLKQNELAKKFGCSVSYINNTKNRFLQAKRKEESLQELYATLID